MLKPTVGIMSSLNCPDCKSEENFDAVKVEKISKTLQVEVLRPSLHLEFNRKHNKSSL